MICHRYEDGRQIRDVRLQRCSRLESFGIVRLESFGIEWNRLEPIGVD
jgi:hypothetical protein